MITCVVGKNKINTFDYKPELLREWSNKKILKCPICGSIMIFNNGEFKIPHFKHEKNCSCPDKYSEGVTEEHIKGIELIHNWLKGQNAITDIELEKWMPETKQRPDIYFKYNNKEYVIEFQCSPISSEFLERRALYKQNNIQDIWVLGCNNYNINQYINDKNYRIKLKTIEKSLYENDGKIIYLNYIRKTFFIINTYDLSLILSKYEYLKTTFYINNILEKDITNLKFYQILNVNLYLQNDNNIKYQKTLNDVDNYIRKINDLNCNQYFRNDYYNFRTNKIEVIKKDYYGNEYFTINSIKEIQKIYLFNKLESIKRYYLNNICNINKSKYFYMSNRDNHTNICINVGFNKYKNFKFYIINQFIEYIDYSTNQNCKIKFNEQNFENKIKEFISNNIRRMRYENI